MNRVSAFMSLALAVGAASAQVHVTAEPGTTAPKGGFPVDDRKPLPPATEALLAQINALRAAGARCGGETYAPALPLQWNEALERAAAVQARDMARAGDLSHTGADGSSAGQRVTTQGYVWGTAGENVAAGNSTASATLAQWMNSPGHCRNIMNPAFTEVAVARQDNPASTYKNFWAMVLATPLR
jgi:uncharacterized protein YkwD